MVIRVINATFHEAITIVTYKAVNVVICMAFIVGVHFSIKCV